VALLKQNSGWLRLRLAGLKPPQLKLTQKASANAMYQMKPGLYESSQCLKRGFSVGISLLGYSRRRRLRRQRQWPSVASVRISVSSVANAAASLFGLNVISVISSGLLQQHLMQHLKSAASQCMAWLLQ